jgi:ParB-like chromosome segregation protein Spo0J
MSDVFVPFAPRRRGKVSDATRHNEDLRRYPARVARQVALAHALRQRIDDGEFADQAAMARVLGFTRARISQMFDLLLLAPRIQEEILFLQDAPGKQAVRERDLRPITLLPLWSEQQRAWRALLGRTEGNAALPAISQSC